jgi:UDP-glucuronate 4-epimerase
MTILITGAAGMIGFHLCRLLAQKGQTVAGLDNFSEYYDVQLKRDRAKRLADETGIEINQVGITDHAALERLWSVLKPRVLIHLAAQAGVRYSFKNPAAYVDSNLVGFGNILEMARRSPLEHLLYASSSSIYGADRKLPWSEDQPADTPLSIYAATKRSNELMAHSYSHLFGLPMTGLRFFTVYGEWGRPDMAIHRFANAIYFGEELELFNRGEMSRDFTYVGDAVEAVVRLMQAIPRSPGADNQKARLGCSEVAPHRVVNIGCGRRHPLIDYVRAIEAGFGKSARLKFGEMSAGEVPDTLADTRLLEAISGYVPSTELSDGVLRFCTWFVDYYGRRPKSALHSSRERHTRT